MSKDKRKIRVKFSVREGREYQEKEGHTPQLDETYAVAAHVKICIPHNLTKTTMSGGGHKWGPQDAL